MIKKILILLFLLIVIIMAVFYFVNNFVVPEKTDNSKINVTASFYPIYFLASQIAGERANVYNLTPAGAEPHDYEPTAQDMAKIENSKMIILNGGGLEVWADNIKQNFGDNVFIVTAGKTEQSVDPHFWLSPAIAQEMVKNILAGFVKIDPANENYYKTNADNLTLRLKNLDNEYKLGLDNCQTKSIVTSHSAFGYLVRDYGLEQISVTGLSPEAEPSTQQLTQVVQFAKRNNVKYIFFESLVSPKLSQTIANEIGAQTLVLNPLEGLTSQEISQGKDYFTVMEQNLTNLKIALECK